MDSVTATIASGGSAVVAAGVLWRATRKPRRWIQHFCHKLDRAVDDVVGVPAVIHPITGEELAPALPGIGARTASLEAAVQTLIARDTAIKDIRAVADHALDVAEQTRADVREHIERCEPSLGVIADKALGVAATAQQQQMRPATA